MADLPVIFTLLSWFSVLYICLGSNPQQFVNLTSMDIELRSRVLLVSPVKIVVYNKAEGFLNWVQPWFKEKVVKSCPSCMLSFTPSEVK
jgi:hypothetical protein